MSDDITTPSTPSASFGGISIKDVDQGINMYLGIFKTAAQATGKGLKTAAAKAGELKDAAIATGGRLTDRVSAAVRPEAKKAEKIVPERTRHHEMMGEVNKDKPLQSMNPVQMQKMEDMLSKHNISHVNIGAHEAYAHQFAQATAVGQAQTQEASLGR